MKKTVVSIVILTILLGGLVAALVLLSGGTEEAPLPQALQDLSRVFDFSGPLRSIVIEQAGAEAFTLENRSDDPDAILGTLAGREDLPVDTAKVSAVLRAGGNLPYTQLVLETPEDYASFGLTPATARVTITSTEGEEVILLIGDIAPDATGRYVKLEGDPAIYLSPIYTLDNYLLSEYDYLNHTVTPSAGFPLLFERMVLSGGGREGEIVILPAEQEGYYRVSEPVALGLDPIQGFAAVSEIFGLQSGNIARIDL